MSGEEKEKDKLFNILIVEGKRVKKSREEKEDKKKRKWRKAKPKKKKSIYSRY